MYNVGSFSGGTRWEELLWYLYITYCHASRPCDTLSRRNKFKFAENMARKKSEGDIYELVARYVGNYVKIWNLRWLSIKYYR